VSRWFRVYDDMVDDPKVQRLSPDLFKALVNLWCLASKNDGVFPSAEDIGFKLRMPVEKVKKVIAALHDAELIDTGEAGLRPHNWGGRQFKTDVTDPTNADRQRRYRNKHKTVTPTVTDAVTVKRPDTETEAETERKQDAAPPAPPLAPMNDETEVFRRGKQVLGPSAGGLIKNLVKAKQGSIPHARAAIEIASTKENPREYIGAIISGTGPPDDARARGDAW
jgi:hypothetical protein